MVLPIYASEVERFGVEAESLRPIVYHRPLQQYSSSDTPWVSSNHVKLVVVSVVPPLLMLFSSFPFPHPHPHPLAASVQNNATAQAQL